MWSQRSQLKRLTLVLVALAVTTGAAAAQVRVTTLADGDEPVKSTAKVRVSRFADFSETDGLSTGDEVAEGDLLTALDPSVRLELTCPRGSLLHFNNGFRVLIQAAETADCAAAFLAGDLDVLTDTDTSVGIGGKTLGTAGTRYAVELHGGAVSTQWIWVFEGRVGVATRQTALTLEPGRMAQYRGQQPSPVEQPISASEVQSWAGRYADFDLIKAKAAGAGLSPGEALTTHARLSELYAQVLARPDDQKARVNLALVQIDNRIGAEAIHNLKRAGVADQKKLDELKINPESLRQDDPQVRRRLDLLLQTSPHFTGISGFTHVAPGPPVGPSDDLAAWLAAKAYDKVIETVAASRKSGTATAREYCLAAQAYAGIGDRKTAGVFAKRALTLAEQGGNLASTDASICRKLAGMVQ